ncbi:MAG: signal recognition particle protein, partial [Victivallaceae bacterium]|nr:signal recognition particle protein [Victivallaceae bacterium]
MFEALGDKLHDVFKRLRGESRLTQENIAETLKEIRLALLDADVNLEVAQKFTDSVAESCLGADVLRSVTPGQQLIKIVHDKLVELLGSSAAELKFDRRPAVIMLVGLHGSGKTTTAGKLALHLKKQGKKVLLVAGDVYRPAAIDQLEIIAKEIDVPVCFDRTSVNVAAIALNAVETATREQYDAVLIDTAGRLQIDDTMVQELVRIRGAVHPDEILLVADAALGQEAVSVARHFHEKLDLTGFILTKLDGDARGGAALSIRQETNVPVKFVGTGEKLDQLEVFFPDRMAGRILGMGDVVSLVEKAAAEIDEEEAKKLQEKLRQNRFDYNDFLTQLRQLGRLGGVEALLRFLPGGRQLSGALGSVDLKQFGKMEAIIRSMTKEERSNPDLLDFSRRKRIARGAGVPVETVGTLVRQFEMMRKMMRQNGALGKMMASGTANGIPAAPMMPGMRGMFAAPSPISRKAQEHRKKLAKMPRKERRHEALHHVA